MNDRPLETLAVAAHGGCVVLHGLAVVFHVARDKRFGKYAALHSAIAIFSAASIVVHAKRLK
jgi:hypothetical protein